MNDGARPVFGEVTVKEAAALAHIGVRHVRLLIANGTIKAETRRVLVTGRRTFVDLPSLLAYVDLLPPLANSAKAGYQSPQSGPPAAIEETRI